MRFWADLTLCFLIALAVFSGANADALADDASSKCLAGNAFREPEVVINQCTRALSVADVDPVDKPKLLASLGEGYYWAGDLPDAGGVMVEALKLDPTLNSTRIQLGWAYDRAGYPKEALKLFTEAAERDPKSGRAQFSLGALYANSPDQHAMAKQYYETALKLDPDYDLAHTELARYYSYWEHDYPKAIAEYDKILAKDPVLVNQEPFASFENLQIKELFEFTLYNKSFLLMDMGRFDEGVSIVNELIKKYPEQGVLYSVLAMGLADLKRYDEAIAQADKALVAKLPCVCGLGTKMISQYKLKKFDDALVTVSQIKTMTKKKEVISEAFFYEGLINKQRGDIPRAKDAFLKSFSTDEFYLGAGITQLIQHGYYVGAASDPFTEKVLNALDACMLDETCLS